MKVISLKQPYATLLAWNLKHFETRSWFTNYRGELLIHASKPAITPWAKKLVLDLAEIICPSLADYEFPLGAIVGKCEMKGCLKMWDKKPTAFFPTKDIVTSEVTTIERMMGDWRHGRFAWKIENPISLDPVECKGQLGLWEVKNHDVIVAINEQISSRSKAA